MVCRLPFMKKTGGKDAEFWKHAYDQVVGQIFFPSITMVDTYKLEFNEVRKVLADIISLVYVALSIACLEILKVK